MSRRFEQRLKCKVPIHLTSGEISEKGVVSDISLTHFKATFKSPLSNRKRYKFSIAITESKTIEGEAKIDKSRFDVEGDYSVVMLMEHLVRGDEIELLEKIREQDEFGSERRKESNVAELAKKRRKVDRTLERRALPKVVITGIGVVSPIGIGRAEFWRSIISHKTGIGKISLFNTEGFPVHIAAEISTKAVTQFIPPKRVAHMSRATMFGWLAAKLAVEDSELSFDLENLDRIGVVMGTTLGALDWAFDQYHALKTDGYKGAHPYTIAAGSSNALSGEISVEYGIRGPSLTFSQGCTSSSMSIAYGVDSIQLGRSEVMIVGGADAPLNSTVFGAFARSGMLSKSPMSMHENVILAKDFTGAVLGEGGCVLVLESYQHAHQRNAPILAEISGSGIATDGYDMIYPDPSGRGIARSIREALEISRIRKEEIDLVMGHFAGVRGPNTIEMRALRREFGEKINSFPVTNVKPLIGYSQGACGAFEVAAACLGFYQPVPWITYNGAHPAGIASHALVTCVGFGGKNVSLVLRRAN